jgi:hypothetical protein
VLALPPLPVLPPLASFVASPSSPEQATAPSVEITSPTKNLFCIPSLRSRTRSTGEPPSRVEFAHELFYDRSDGMLPRE